MRHHLLTRGRAGILALITAVTASLTIAGVVTTPSNAGQDSNLCTPDSSRVNVPNDFFLPACFNGKTLILRNSSEFPVYVGSEGDAGAPYQKPYGGVPEAASLILTYIRPSEPGLLMPGYELHIPIGNSAATVTLYGSDLGKAYVLLRTLASFMPTGEIVGFITAVNGLVTELTDVWDKYQNCSIRGGFWGDLGCDAIYYRDVAFALGRAFAKGVYQSAKVSAAVVNAVIALLETAGWANQAAKDLNSWIHGPRTLRFAAAETGTPPTDGPPDPPKPPGSLSFSLSGSCTTDGGTITSRSGGFTSGRHYTIRAWYPNGSGYPLGSGAGGTVRRDGSIAWNWPCAGDPPGNYSTEVIDDATGRSTGRVGFAIGNGVPDPPPPARTYAEQQGSRGANTFTNPYNASGVGQRIEPYQWVEVSCKVHAPQIDSANPDGYWYRIASSPWNNAYYAVANTFWNGDIPGQTPYTHNTDFAVPNC